MKPTSSFIFMLLVLPATLQADYAFFSINTEGSDLRAVKGYDLSANGSIVVGQAHDYSLGRPVAYMWTAANGLTDLGRPSGGDYESYAYGISDDGTTVVGTSYTHTDGPRAFRWTASTGMQLLPRFSNDFGNMEYFAEAVSDNGEAIVGWASDFSGGGPVAFRWTAADGMQRLGTSGSAALDVTPDGAFVVGRSGGQAGYWDAAGDFTAIVNGGAEGISADGRFIVGRTTIDSSRQGYRWSREDGVELLLDPTGAMEVQGAYAVSDDGRFVVGASGLLDESAVYLWDEVNGARNIGELIEAAGFTLEPDWIIDEVWSMSEDGNTIAISNQGVWLFSGYTIPEPRVYALIAGLSALGLLRWRHKRA
ncbi:MAG: putative extracellular repeat HAF family [Puniceicoccaceae bacterium 5H]|nr:MAG: putative extracellular repeat HAF family [Puniceicoccaceae bacterium 5H]